MASMVCPLRAYVTLYLDKASTLLIYVIAAAPLLVVAAYVSRSEFETCVLYRCVGLKGKGVLKYNFKITAGNILGHKYQLSSGIAMVASLHHHPV